MYKGIHFHRQLQSLHFLLKYLKFVHSSERLNLNLREMICDHNLGFSA